jgi:2-keto-4-pentenoate hydratase/2-oxohepta-3-ene-1,7-dioic acid hydratase in catechol pathway
MKIVVYGPERRVGALVGTDVIDLNAAAGLPSDLEQFILQGDRAIEAAQRAIDQGGHATVPASEAGLRAPLAHRGVKICMAGANYADHAFDTMRSQNPNITMEEVTEQARKRGIAGFWKLSEFVVDPEAGVTYPAKSKWLDYEGEVTIVIGRAVKDFKGSDATPHIWGYTLQNDWSARDIGDGVLGGLSWSSQKNWDCSSSIGPCIVVGEINDPQNVDFQTTVNGHLRQKGNTSAMTFSFAEYLQHITRDITFRAGDMISAGTCKGTAMDQTPRLSGPEVGFQSDKLFLRVGEVVEVSSPQIGVLRNKVVAK